ncbi:cytochrome P450 [Nocardioides sp.]|uniref:cytochrome P450 n=1 Tax=Nocardioides sp. TaxID=35761 RepID=UPI0026039E8F|nr:cytochrome P450 [Nocardioides sp.]
MSGVATGVAFDPYDYEFHEDPYPTYARLRAEAPLFHAVDDDLWVLSRYEDIWAALRDDTTFSNRMGVSLDASAWSPEAHRVMSFLALDGAAQTRLRRLVSAAFTPRRIADLEPTVQGLADHYLDRVVTGTEVDWIADLAGRLPMDVISEMMGVPVADRDHVRALADLVVHREDGVRDVPPAGMSAAIELISYYAAMVGARRDAPPPADGAAPDLTWELAQAEIDGDRLTDAEIIAFLFLMVVAGNETTTKLLGNALFHLAAHPEAVADVLADPGLVDAWIEETLRHDTSSQMIARYVAEEFELHGTRVPVGAKLLLLLGSANRDGDVFEHPDTFDLHRDPAEWARILSFGNGRHFCLGAHLARLEARVVLRSLIERIAALQVRSGGAVRVHSTSVRGFSALPVTFTPRSAE